jgi:hypothetical protein
LVDQLKVLRALEDYWEDVGVVLASHGRTDDGSFIGGDIDESFLRGGAEVERGGAVLALDISAIEPNMDQSAIHDVSVDDINGLDTSELNVEYWSEQLTNHRDLVQGLHEWIHSDPSRQRCGLYPFTHTIICLFVEVFSIMHSGLERLEQATLRTLTPSRENVLKP